MCFGSLNNECIVFYEMTEFHKRSIGERRLRRYAKAEAEKDNVKFHLFHAKGTSTKRRKSNKPGQIVENKRGKKNIALNDQHDQSDKSFEEMSMTEFVSRINSTKKSKTGTASSEADEHRSLENITEEEEPNENDPVQTDTAADTDGRRTGVIALLKQMYEKTKKIERRQTNLENNIEEIKQLLLSRTETLTHPKDLPKLPLQAYAD